MFVRDFTELEIPFDAAEAILLREPLEWLPEVASGTEARRDRLLSDVGVGKGLRLHRPVEVEVHEPVRVSGRTVLPITWRAANRAAFFPGMEADLELAPLGPGSSQLALTGRYTPPLGAVGRAADRALLHRVAEATVRDFLRGVADRMLAATVAGAHQH